MSFENVTMEKVTAIVKSAKETCINREQALEITEKGAANFVTAVDTRVQEFMRVELEKLNAKIEFMGEEQDNDAIDFANPVWILDPVDGTSNLIHDFRNSSLSLALYAEGELKMGIVCHLFADELYCAEKGKGAFLNGRPIHVSPVCDPGRSLVSIGTSPYRKELADEEFEIYKKVFVRCEDIRRIGSAALDLAYVAAGRIETYFEFSLNPWDFAAGILLVQEAGGTVTDYEGKTVDITRGSSIVAGNGVIDEIIRKEILNQENGDGRC